MAAQRDVLRHVTAFAPASVANVAAGFDILGFAASGPGDYVTVGFDDPRAEPGIRLEPIEPLEPTVPLRRAAAGLPTGRERNTATVAIAALCDHLRVEPRLKVRLVKGIPLGSGMGGSAASAVAATVAAARLLGMSPGVDELLPFALAGEKVASGEAHADNVAPSLLGGLTAVVDSEPPRVCRLPIPAGLYAVLVHPHLSIETRAARAALAESVPLTTHVAQSMALAGLISGCYEADIELISRSLKDLIAGPVRSRAIPGFDAACAAARTAGAIGFGVSGSGPSVFAWAEDLETAGRVRSAIREVFTEERLATDGWRFELDSPGARIVDGVPGRESDAVS